MARKKPVVNYETAHNRAVRQFKRASMFILWAAGMNLISAIAAIVRGGTVDFSFSFAFNDIIFRTLLTTGLPTVWVSILIVLIGMVSSAAFAALGVFANLGNRIPLYLATGLYFLDFILLFIFPVEEASLYWTALIFHAMFFALFLYAIWTYYAVLAVETRFKKTE